ncbi:MAG: TatD family hydrolase [Clostridia bacterium]|nr:TatD family hydrolase [Clostridia bacterium]
MLFDSHAHYDDEKFDGIRDELLPKMPEYGVKRIVNAGASIKGSYASRELAHKYDFMYFTAGIHPESAFEDMQNPEWLSEIEALCRDEKCVAVGEIGLDYYWSRDHIAEQKECFIAHLELARRLGLPAVIHDREAHGDCLEIVKNYTDVKILFHCYSGSVEMLREILKMGMYISMGGVVTFKNARKTVEAIEALVEFPDGPSRLLLETDCPYLAPVPHRGELNHSGLMVNTAEKIAEITGLTKEEIEAKTFDNAISFYNMK